MLGNSSVPGRRIVCVVININNTENLTGIALANRFVQCLCLPRKTCLEFLRTHVVCTNGKLRGAGPFCWDNNYSLLAGRGREFSKEQKIIFVESTELLESSFWFCLIPLLNSTFNSESHGHKMANEIMLRNIMDKLHLLSYCGLLILR